MVRRGWEWVRFCRLRAFLRPRWKWVGAAIVTPAVAAFVTVLVTDFLADDPPDHAIARVPTICTIRGIPDSGYLNATLTGTTKSVVAVAAWIVDDHHWYFKPVRHEGASWSAPPDPTYLWEVGQPGDSSQTTFTFAMLSRSKGIYHQLPAEGDGRRTIPDGFQIVGEQIALTKWELLAGGFHRSC